MKIGKPKASWHKWFAWYPVYTWERQLVWFEWVERKCKYTSYGSYFYSEYREIK